MHNTPQALYLSISTTTVFWSRVSFKRQGTDRLLHSFFLFLIVFACSLLHWSTVSESWDMGQDGVHSPGRAGGCAALCLLLLKIIPRYCPRLSFWPSRHIVILCQVKVQTSWGVGLLNEHYGLLVELISFFLPGLLGKTPIVGANMLYLSKVKLLRERGGGITPLSRLPPSSLPGCLILTYGVV